MTERKRTPISCWSESAAKRRRVHASAEKERAHRASVAHSCESDDGSPVGELSVASTAARRRSTAAASSNESFAKSTGPHTRKGSHTRGEHGEMHGGGAQQPSSEPSSKTRRVRLHPPGHGDSSVHTFVPMVGEMDT